LQRFKIKPLLLSVVASLIATILASLAVKVFEWTWAAAIAGFFAGCSVMFAYLYSRGGRALDLMMRSPYPGLLDNWNELADATSLILRPLEGRDHPIELFLETWFKQVVRELKEGGAAQFEVDPSYYQACLASLNKWPDDVYAVADFSGGFEAFWKSDHPVEETRVTQRLFILTPKQLFEEDQVYRLNRLLRRHASSYSVFISHSTPDALSSIPFDSSPGKDMILVPGDFVGGYARQDGQVRLRIVRDGDHFNYLKSRFDNMVASAVPVKAGGGAEDLRSEWLKSRGIGQWNESWNTGRIADRSSDYFINYDAHIRAWIPYYDELIRHCARRALERLREIRKKRRVVILEIGCGTGALTAELLESPALAQVGEIRYIGVDEAQRIYDSLLEQAPRRYPNVSAKFYEGALYPDSGWRGFSDSALQGEVDLIIGSLVLHDLVQSEPRANFFRLLNYLGGLLAPTGSMVFADVFTSADPSVRDQEIEFWKEGMQRKGLCGEWPERFLSRNPEMVNTVTQEMVDSLGEVGFEGELQKVGPSLSPFQVLAVNRI